MVSLGLLSHHGTKMLFIFYFQTHKILISLPVPFQVRLDRWRHLKSLNYVSDWINYYLIAFHYIGVTISKITMPFYLLNTLGDNGLTGSIPIEIGLLTSLEWLDLSKCSNQSLLYCLLLLFVLFPHHHILLRSIFDYEYTTRYKFPDWFHSKRNYGHFTWISRLG